MTGTERPAGDAPVDAAMAREADLFLAVAGQGDFARRFAGTVSARESTAALRARLIPARNVVLVPREERFEAALRTVPRAVGVRADRD